MAVTNSLAWIYLHTYASRFVQWHGILGLLPACGLLLVIGSQICFSTWESCLSFTSTPISKEPRPCSAFVISPPETKILHLAIFPPPNRLLWCLLESWNIFHTPIFFPCFVCLLGYLLYPIDAVYIDYHFFALIFGYSFIYWAGLFVSASELLKTQNYILSFCCLQACLMIGVCYMQRCTCESEDYQRLEDTALVSTKDIL